MSTPAPRPADEQPAEPPAAESPADQQRDDQQHTDARQSDARRSDAGQDAVNPSDANPSDARQSDARQSDARPGWQRWLASSGSWVLAIDVILIVVFTAINSAFFSLQNFQSLTLNATEALLLAMGMAMMLSAGQFDLSVGANLALSSVVGAKLIGAVAGNANAEGFSAYHSVGWAFLIGVLGCLVTGLVFGIVNGVLIAYVKVNSLIATLATMGVGTGIGFILTNGGDINGLPPQLQDWFGLRVFFNIPAPVVVAFVLVIVTWATLRFLNFGVTTLAIGSSSTAAERAGIDVRRHVVKLMAIGGTFAGLAGFVDIARYSSTAITGHANDGLAALTAVVIGGTALEGGRVNILGAVWGTFLAVILLAGLVIADVKPYYQLLMIGLVLILAVALNRRTARTPGAG